MEQATLKIEKREERGKGPARRARKMGKLPGVIYGLGKNTPVFLDLRFVSQQLMGEGRNKIFSVTGNGGDRQNVMIKDYQVDPVSRKLIHLDLLEIDIAQKILVTVPILITGKSVGVAEGGVLNHIERELQVRCLPNEIPKNIEVDVTNLRIGDSLHLSDVPMPPGVESATQLNSTLVTVVPPTKEEEAAPSLAPSAEPEVITAKKEAPEEGAEAAAQAAPAGEKKEKEEKKK